MSVSNEFLLFMKVYITLVVLVGFSGNLLTIIVVCRFKKLQSVGNIFIASMSISDGLYFITVLPFRWLTLYYKEWLWGDFFCTFLAALGHMLIGASILHLAVIALNRLVNIKLPSRYHKLYGPRMVALNLTLSWGISLVICFLPVFNLWGSFSYQAKTYQCTMTSGVDDGFRYLLVTLALVLPSVFMLGCYSVIWYHVRMSKLRVGTWRRSTVQASPADMVSTIHLPPENHQPMTRGVQRSQLLRYDPDEVTMDGESTVTDISMADTRNPANDGQKRPRYRRSRPSSEAIKLTMTMMCIFLVFFVSILPYFVVNVVDSKTTNPTAHLVALMFTWANGCLNPVIYCAMNLKFRTAFKSMFSWQCCKR